MALEWNRKGVDIVYYDGSMPGKGTINIGSFSSVTAGSGLKLSSARTFVQRICADDAGAALTVGSAYRAGERRMLLTVAQPGDVSIFGGEDHLKLGAADHSSNTAHMAGSWGYLEMVAGATIKYGAGVKGMADLPSTAVIAAGGVLSAFMAASNTLAGTHTGNAAAIHVPNPVAGTWDAFAAFGSATGACAAKATALSGLTSTHRVLVICPDGNVGYIPVIQTWS